MTKTGIFDIFQQKFSIIETFVLLILKKKKPYENFLIW